MIAAPNPHRETASLHPNAILRDDRSEVRLDDITTAADGQAILDEIGLAILKIQDQLALGDFEKCDPTWRTRAESALRRKQWSRGRLQQRVAELRKAERQAEVVALAGRPARDRAFINAAEELLPPETFTEIWARAQEQRSAAFAEGGRS